MQIIYQMSQKIFNKKKHLYPYPTYKYLSTAPGLKFELSQEAALHNMRLRLLESYNNDIHQYLQRNVGAFINFGSEFRDPVKLEPLLMHHPNWLRFRSLLVKGSNWELKPISRQVCIAKNTEFIL